MAKRFYCPTCGAFRDLTDYAHYTRILSGRCHVCNTLLTRPIRSVGYKRVTGGDQ